MNLKKLVIVAMLTAATAGAVFAFPQPGTIKGSHSAGAVVTSARGDENDQRIEGEQRFRTNCGRCHVAPHKFSPRMMATIIRHMRVRATLTDSDMRIILRYMTQ